MIPNKQNNSLIQFSLEFTEEQKKAREVCHKNVVTILTGKPGTSKSTIAASVALELINRKEKPTSKDYRNVGKYDKIIITRPTVTVGKSMGFLPGDMAEKLSPYTTPILNVIDELIKGSENSYSQTLIEKGKIEIIPIQFMRGHTFKNCVVILDEGQNADLEDFKVISSRLGYQSKLIVTSDWRQIDLFDRKKSASQWLDKIYHLDGVGTFELTENFRHPLAVKIMDILLESSNK